MLWRICRITLLCLTYLALGLAPAQAFTHTLAQPQKVVAAVNNPAATKPIKVRTVWPWTPFSDRQSAYPVLGKKTAKGQQWLRLSLPGRPNGLTGWVPSQWMKTVPATWFIRVDLSKRIMAVRHNSKLVKRLLVVIGTSSTPTPSGRFFVEDRVQLGESWARNGWALATSAYSDALRHFEGGYGQIAIHTRGNLSAPMGTAASHGCVRVPIGFAKWLARVIPSGTPIEIVR